MARWEKNYYWLSINLSFVCVRIYDTKYLIVLIRIHDMWCV